VNILITGGTGFIGTNLCKALANQGHYIKIIDRTIKNLDLLTSLSTPIEFIKIDYTKINNYRPYLKNIDIIFHLISTTLPSTSNDNKEFDVVSNVCSTIRLLEDAVVSGVKKIVFFSSGGTVYGETQAENLTEEHPTNPICSYGIHKLTIEKYLHYFWHSYGLNYLIVRLSNPYGWNQIIKKGQGVVPIFIQKIIQDEDIQIWGDGLNVRDYIYIDDVINALNLLINYEGQTKIFNLGSGKGYSLLEVINTISDILCIKPKINFIEARNIDVRRNVLDITKIQKEIKWKPEVNLREGIMKVLQ
jgi:UDP-glucose 4-epimerase